LYLLGDLDIEPVAPNARMTVNTEFERIWNEEVIA
jgi:hypothetical protein